ncbi:von Willebrand factor type A domain protein [bacterium BMS3Bbin10]|nr:von Willebrand factor type A domain protein [bacterium BMS3Bbin10]
MRKGRISTLLGVLVTFCTLAAGLSWQGSARAEEAENVMLIFDASGSMWGQIDGKPKYEIARDVVGGVLSDMSGKVNLGLMVYGHRTKGNCKDIETVIPVSPIDAGRYMTAIRKIRPKGKTPITAAVRKAAEGMRYREEKSTVILVSDGLETCKVDPCALAKELERDGVDFTVHVVGFDLKKQDTSSLRCLAEATGGKFLSAENAGELGQAVGQVVAAVKEPQPAPVPEPQPVAEPAGVKLSALLSEGGELVKSGLLWTITKAGEAGKPVKKTAKSQPELALEPGKYHVLVTHRLARAETGFEVPESGLLEKQVVLNAGLLKVSAIAEEGGETLTGVLFYLYDGAGKKLKSRGGGETGFVAGAGTYKIEVVFGKIKATASADIAAGETTDIVVTLGSGFIKPSMRLSAGADAGDRDVIYTIYEAKQNLQGKRKRLLSRRGSARMAVSSGKYYVEAKYGSAVAGVEVEVRAGQLVEPVITLGAGILSVRGLATEGGEQLSKIYFTVFENRKSLDGTRKKVISGQGSTPKYKLSAGKYYVTAVYGFARASGEFEVKSGELTQAAINLNAGVLEAKAAGPDGKEVYRPYFTVYEAKKNLEGKRKRITGTGGSPRSFRLTAGKYFLVVTSRKKTVEQDVEVKAGERTEVTAEFSE